MNQRFKSLKWLALGTIVVVFAVAGVVLAADVVIDDFSYETTFVSATIPSSPSFPLATQCDSASGISMVSTIGGNRTICLEITGGSSNSAGVFRTDADNDYMDLALDTGVYANAFIQWDGSDISATIDPDGLRLNGVGEDLTDSGSNAGLLLQTTGADNRQVSFVVSIYHDSANWMQRTVPFKADIAEGDLVDVFLPFASFTVQAGSMTQAEIAQDTGAIEVKIDVTAASGSSSSADLRMRIVKAASVYEYGDLPLAGASGLPAANTGYSTDILNARHIPLGMRFGRSVDVEADNQDSLLTDGDDDAFDDEDGIQKAYMWDATAEDWTVDWSVGTPDSFPYYSTVGGAVTVEYYGCASSGVNRCRINGWIDWNRDGDFADINEKIVDNVLKMSDHSGERFEFAIPSGVTFTDVRYYARFRICPSGVIGACDDPDSTDTDVSNGEIEDYYFQWGDPPTAVTLASFEVTSQDNALLVTWETASELDNVGFNLYRSETEEGPYAQLNETLIPPQFPGEVMGGYYEWLDTDVQPGVTYYYKLEDIDVKGVSAFHGPVSTSVVAAPAAVGVQRVFASGVALPVVLGLTLLLGAVVATRRRR